MRGRDPPLLVRLYRTALRWKHYPLCHAFLRYEAHIVDACSPVRMALACHGSFFPRFTISKHHWHGRGASLTGNSQRTRFPCRLGPSCSGSIESRKPKLRTSVRASVHPASESPGIIRAGDEGSCFGY